MPIAVHLKAAEIHLMEMLEDIVDQPFGWQAIHFHLNDLIEHYKSDYQAKIAVNLIHDLLKHFDGGIFLMDDSSIIVICRGLEKTLQNKLVFQLRYLYMDDPLAYTETGQENPDFCKVYDLKRTWKEFHSLAQRRMAAFTRRPAIIDAPEERWFEKASKTLVKEKGMLSAFSLAAIERDLNYADLNKAVRRQPVCAVLPNAPVRRVFDELYIHIAHLRQMLKSDVDFLSNRWLFKYLTRILDDRMIELLTANRDRYLVTPVSLNLNVETLLSSRFAEFDAILNPEAKVSVVIEVPVMDVFADMRAFQLARAEVQRLGYRVCLDGLTSASLASINREKLGLNLVKVQWNAELSSELGTEQSLEMVEAVRAAGTNRVILCRCDNRNAVEFGQALGISLFQGRYIDSVLNPTSKVEN